MAQHNPGRNSGMSQAGLSVPVSDDSLLRGAFYAVEQAWHLLQGAVLLFQNSNYSCSLVLSIYCLEELGRCEIFLKQRVSGTGTVTVARIRGRSNNHALKLGQGQIPVTVSLSGVGTAPVPGSPEEAPLLAQLRRVGSIREARAPDEAHSARFRALYVDPADDGEHWNRPARIERDEADSWLGAADLAYTFKREQLLQLTRVPELNAFFQAWGSCPDLPEARWDVWDWTEAIPK